MGGQEVGYREGQTVTHEFSPAHKKGVYEAIARRRTSYTFVAAPLSDALLARLLLAAHHAGSVGFMQPWNFVVIRDLATRQRVHTHVDAERRKAAEAFAGERRERYLALKLEGIVDAPVNLCVTCDPTRHGPAVIGRNTIKEADVYSTCCAIQNLWLAARAEGVGVGWVSIWEPEALRALLGIPAHVIPVAYLCLGYVASFAARPSLEIDGWLPRVPLPELVFAERWGGGLSTGFYQQLQAERFLDV